MFTQDKMKNYKHIHITSSKLSYKGTYRIGNFKISNIIFGSPYMPKKTMQHAFPSVQVASVLEKWVFQEYVHCMSEDV